jgi:hypothetical protein
LSTSGRKASKHFRAAELKKLGMIDFSAVPFLGRAQVALKKLNDAPGGASLKSANQYLTNPA